ncbi:MAG TPA: peptidylprolyl isomerase [Pseudogracilibacillus sp.]|nr:peptidylprolyl isomerase [Pseudogracilibacillus sp.]
MRKLGSIILLALVLTIVVACGNENDKTDKESEGNVDSKPVVSMEMESGDIVEMELYPDIAPNTVANFVTLVEDGFYDGLIFHRVIPGFMIQGGDPEGTGMGGPGYYIPGEFASNDFENSLKHERGVLSMARSNHPDSAGSQFFIMVEDAEHLDGDYASFGKVISGMETVDDIVAVDRDGNDKPNDDQVIKKMTVDLDGYDLPKVEQSDV